MHSAARLISSHLSRLTAVHCLDALEMINFDLFLQDLFFSFLMIYEVLSVIALMTNKTILYHVYGQGSMVGNNLESGRRLETANLSCFKFPFHSQLVSLSVCFKLT